jgi:hypothetical protein|tara:strand:+ start:253 stop:534 length:282 start_codon:yes stop_codon:yes gene_type:complete
MIGGADNKNQPAYLSFQALNKILSNVDKPQFDYDGFKVVYDANPDLQAYIKNFDDKGVTLATKVEAPSDAQVQTDSGTDTVDQMAKRATAKAQ